MNIKRAAHDGWLGRAFGALLLGAMLLPAVGISSASAWWNSEWTQRKKIVLDLGAAGGNIAEPVGANVPVLVRLHAGNFRFDAAKEDGSDLRFMAGDDKTPLKYAIEKFDPLMNEALVWVGVPDLKPGGANDIWLYYGNKKAGAGAEAKAVFDPDTTLVYHFAERGSAPPADATTWGNSALTPGTAATGALIGGGLRFDGSNVVQVPGSPSLVISDNASMTLSVWFNMAAPSPRGAIYSRRDGGSAMVLGVDNGVPFLEVTGPGGVQRTAPSTPVPLGSWHHFAVVVDVAQTTLYLDGASYGTVSGGLPALTSPATLGGEAGAARPAADGATDVPADAAATAAPAAVANPFLGDIDEFQVSKVARPPGFIKFMAMEQGTTPNKVIAYAVDEKGGSWFDLGYFGIILDSVTVDGWVVIALLAVMAVMSWYVMYNRFRYLGRQAKANEMFLRAFRKTADDLTELDQGEADEQSDEEIALIMPAQGVHKSVATHSSLYRIYHIGATDIERRMARKGRLGFTEQAIASIRAALDTQFLKETQKLNRFMVVLTIAISGGPFLGLLGTVVGVMITFAAIAATGDVNINAIAPGIAAALVATVAGLAVAIPALFAYNYFILRITDLTSDMQAFIDEFETRIAEAYQPSYAEPQRQAAE